MPPKSNSGKKDSGNTDSKQSSTSKSGVNNDRSNSDNVITLPTGEDNQSSNNNDNNTIVNSNNVINDTTTSINPTDVMAELKSLTIQFNNQMKENAEITKSFQFQMGQITNILIGLNNQVNNLTNNNMSLKTSMSSNPTMTIDSNVSSTNNLGSIATSNLVIDSATNTNMVPEIKAPNYSLENVNTYMSPNLINPSNVSQSINPAMTATNNTVPVTAVNMTPVKNSPGNVQSNNLNQSSQQIPDKVSQVTPVVKNGDNNYNDKIKSFKSNGNGRGNNVFNNNYTSRTLIQHTGSGTQHSNRNNISYNDTHARESLTSDRSNTESDNESESGINPVNYQAYSQTSSSVNNSVNKYNLPPYLYKVNEPEPVKLARRETPTFAEFEHWLLAIKLGIDSVPVWIPLLKPIPECYKEYARMHYMVDNVQVIEANYLAAQRSAWKWIMSGFPPSLMKLITTEFEKKAESEFILGPEKLNFSHHSDRNFYKNCHQLIAVISDRYGRRNLNMAQKLLDAQYNLVYNPEKGISDLFNQWRNIQNELEVYGEGYKPPPISLQIPQIMKKLPDYILNQVKAIVESNNQKGEYKSLDELERFLSEFCENVKQRKNNYSREGQRNDNINVITSNSDINNGDQLNDTSNDNQNNYQNNNRMRMRNMNNNNPRQGRNNNFNRNNNWQPPNRSISRNEQVNEHQVVDTSSGGEGGTDNLITIGIFHAVPATQNINVFTNDQTTSDELDYDDIKDEYDNDSQHTEEYCTDNDDQEIDENHYDDYDNETEWSQDHESESVNAIGNVIKSETYAYKVMLDSGASMHATPHRNLLKNIRNMTPVHVNTVTSMTRPVGHEAGILQISDQHKLLDVRYIKGAQYNIASVSRICDANQVVIFDKTGCYILKGPIKIREQDIVISGSRTKDNLYFLHGSLLSKDQKEKLSGYSNRSKTLIQSQRVGNDKYDFNRMSKSKLSATVKPDPNKGFSATARNELKNNRQLNNVTSKVDSSDNTDEPNNTNEENNDKLQNSNNDKENEPVTLPVKPTARIPRKPQPISPSIKQYNMRTREKFYNQNKIQESTVNTFVTIGQYSEDSDPEYGIEYMNVLQTIAIVSQDNDTDDTVSDDKTVDDITNESKPDENISEQVNLYHCRLAHPGADRLLQANKFYKLGLPQDQIESLKQNKKCKVCHTCKSKRVAINHAHPNRTPIAQHVMHVWHADLVGPFSVIQEGRRIHNITIDNDKYILVIVDEFSRYYMVIPLQSKMDATVAIINQINLMQNVTSKKLGRLHTDGGGEFINSTLESFLQQNGSLLTTTTKHTPQLNGIAERAIQTLTVQVRCMLCHSNSPLELRSLAYTYSAQIHNLLPSKAIKYQIPANIFFGENSVRLTLKHLRVFGCDAYARIDDDNRGKIQPNASPYIFIGFSSQYSAYQLMNPKTLEIIVDRNVSFNELSFESLINAKDVIAEKIRILSLNDDEKEFEVENILARDVVKDKLFYLVLWKGYSTPTWEPEENLVNCQQLLSRFNDIFKKARKLNSKNIKKATIAAAAGKKIQDRGYTIPQRYSDAITHPDAEKWKQAIKAELESMREQEVFILSKLPDGRKRIGNRWVFDIKRDAAGQIVKFKARLVIQGFSQEFGVDYYDTFSPTVKIKTIKFLLAIAAQHDLEIQQLDFKTAFLNAGLDEEIYMKIPEGYDNPRNNYDCIKLNKALYGLKQAPRVWWLQLDEFLVGLEYQRSPLDECLYYKKVNNDFIYLTLYVDDTLAFYDKSLESIWLADKQKIVARYKIDDIGEAKWILKMEIIRDRLNNVIRLSQKSYVSSIIQNLTGINVNELKPANHPFKYEDITAIPNDNEMSQPLNDKEHTLYRSIVGSLLYAANITRIDLSFIVGQLARYCTNPLRYHMEGAKQALRYVMSSTNLELQFQKADDFNVVIYTDSSWGDNRDDRKGTGGYVTMFNNRPVAWQSKKHSTTPLSSTEAEYYALANAVREAIFVQQWFRIYRETDIKVKIFCDNLGAIHMSDHTTDHNRTKHIDILHFFIREHIRQKGFSIKHIYTQNQLADILTKSFKCHPIKFTSLVQRLLIMNPG